MKRYTHTGILRGDARCSGPKQVILRETPKYWVTKYGAYYSKRDGLLRTSDPFPMYHLDLSTVIARDYAASYSPPDHDQRS